jgi:hypothetical protein
MRVTIMFRGQTEQEREQDKADGSLFFRSENKDLAPDFFWGLHLARGLTGIDRYLPRSFPDKSALSTVNS